MNDKIDYSFSKEMITSTVRLRLLSIGIIHYTYLPNSEVDEKEHLINYHATLELIGPDRKLPIMIDSDEFINVTSKAKKLIRQLESTIPIVARALVIKSFGHRILANFYIKVHKPIIPTVIFTDHSEAIKWLITFQQQSFL